MPRANLAHLESRSQHDSIDDFYNLFLQGDEKENTYKKTHPAPSEAGAKASTSDPMTNLGGQCFVMLCIVLIKVWAQCTGVDSPNDNEITASDTWKLHDAFKAPFQKMMG
jgi:hypothetical protein